MTTEVGSGNHKLVILLFNVVTGSNSWDAAVNLGDFDSDWTSEDIVSESQVEFGTQRKRWWIMLNVIRITEV